MKKISKIIIHCSDSPDTVDIGVREIRLWHTMQPPAGRGWADIGYHAVVRRSGVVEMGRYEDGDSILEGKEIGAHVSGENSDSLSICWVGKKKITYDQRRALLGHVLYWMKLHNIPAERVFGHYEFDKKKTCPNINMDYFRKDLLAAINTDT